MMTLVERLRTVGHADYAMMDQAADEIERLEKALETAREDAIEEAAKMAEADFRSELAKKNGHIPDWLAHGRRIAAAIRTLSQKKEG